MTNIFHTPLDMFKREIMPTTIVALLAGVVALLVPVPIAFGITVVAAAIAIAARWPMLAWSLVVLAYPFIYFQFFIGQTINIPYVDLFAIVTFVGVLIHFLVVHIRDGRFFNIQHLTFNIPGLLPFLLFIAVAALSLANMDDLGAGIKFLLRPLSFFYLMFIVLPAVVIDRPQRLFTTFRLLFIVGGIAAMMGLWSLVFPPEPGGFRRAVPIAVHGMTPLGTNHNLIAEVLVSVIPIGAILAMYAHGIRRRWYVVGTIVFALVALLTFSRNGWLTLAVEVSILFVAFARIRGYSWRRVLLWASPIMMAAAIIIAIFSTTSFARSSNVNRMQLTRIAFAQFRAHPFIGAGVGTFQEVVARDKWYIAEFGQPQEAHGLVQKLLAETGAFGLLTFLWLLGSILAAIVRTYARSRAAPAWRFIILALLCAAVGSMVFQLFNTSYFVSKLWLPLGVAIAAARLSERSIALRIREM